MNTPAPFYPYAEIARQAIVKAGGASQLATRLSIIRREKIERNRVQAWTIKGVPSRFVIDVEVLTGIPREELRPDVFYDVAS